MFCFVCRIFIVQVVRSSRNVINALVRDACGRLLGVLRENALGAQNITYAGHNEKSLCSDNDPPVLSLAGNENSLLGLDRTVTQLY